MGLGDTTRRLSELGLAAASDVAVTGLSLDSRTAARGSLFAALPGARAHGAAFVQAALDRGVAAVLTDAAGAALARERDARPRRCAPRHAQKLTGHLLGRRLTLGLGERPRVVERAPRASLVVRQRRRVEGYARAVERERHGHARVVRTRAVQ